MASHHKSEIHNKQNRNPQQLEQEQYDNWITEVQKWQRFAALFWMVIASSTVFHTLQFFLTFNVSIWFRKFFSVRYSFFCYLFVMCSIAPVFTRNSRKVIPSFFNLRDSVTSLMKPAAVLCLLGHIWCAHVCCWSLLNAAGGQLSFYLFKPGRKEHASVFLNSESVAVVASMILFALVRTFLLLLSNLDVLAFSPLHQGRIYRLKATIPHLICWSGIRSVCYVLFSFLCLHFLFPSVVSVCVALTPGSLGFDTNTLNFSYLTFTAKIFLLTFTIEFVWELNHTLLSILFTQLLSYLLLTFVFYHVLWASIMQRISFFPCPSNIDFLPFGLHSNNQYIKQMALVDLLYVVDHVFSRRQILFTRYWQTVYSTTTALLQDLLKSIYEDIYDREESGPTDRLLPKVFAWFVDRRKARIIFREYRLHVLAIECLMFRLLLLFPFSHCKSMPALSILTAKSLKEDTDGVVSRSLEDIISLFVACALAIEQRDSNIPHYSRDQIVWRPESTAVSIAIDNALYRILYVFYEHLGDFRFPAEYACRLEAYLSTRK